jgi:hypothetical protein
MEEFARHLDVTLNDLKHVQYCCLHLGVMTLADTCDSNGIDLCSWAIAS